MNLQIRSKDLTLTQQNKDHIENAVEVFRKFSLDITSIRCLVSAEKKGVSVEFEIHVAHSKAIVINQHDDVLDAAIDIAVDRASKALRRLHDKITSNSKVSIKDLEPIEA
jgi:putative sigma-54 modulation protein